MKSRIIIILLFNLTLFGCDTLNGSKELNTKKIQLSYEIIPEDYDRNLYYVNWNDTLGLSEGYLPEKFLKRPKELWCFITNKRNDTLGYYKGLSMPQSFAGFQTTDTIVTLNFMIGLNILPEKFDTDTNGAMEFYRANKNPIEFEPVDINIRTDLRQTFKRELKEKK